MNGSDGGELGRFAEAAALTWLQQQGLICVTQNFRCKGGEIDLIMSHKNQLVFVEVRLRSASVFGGAAESVTRTKQRRIIHAARQFLVTQPRWQQYACRFDVLAASRTRSHTLEWQWLQNAFITE
jgi:putative endonuclease